MLQTLQLMQGEGYRPEAPVEPPAGGVEYGEMVPVPGGPFVMGTGDRARALDNERDAPEVHVPGFLMDRTPVTNAPYLEFVESGGYGKRELWDPAGWECIKQERISAPKHWYQPEPHSWWTARFVFDGPLDPALPVVLVSRYEADAYARSGPASTSRRRRSGRRRPPGTRRAGPGGFSRGATGPRRRRKPTSISSPPPGRIRRRRARTGCWA